MLSVQGLVLYLCWKLRKISELIQVYVQFAHLPIHEGMSSLGFETWELNKTTIYESPLCLAESEMVRNEVRGGRSTTAEASKQGRK